VGLGFDRQLRGDSNAVPGDGHDCLRQVMLVEQGRSLLISGVRFAIVLPGNLS